MSQSPDHETRISRLEARIEEVAADAAAARHLAAMNDRDLADVGVKLDANRKAINALGEQTRGRFDQVDTRFDQVDRRFERLDTRFDQVDRRFERLEAKVDAGFAVMDAKFAEYDQGFAAMRHGFDQTAAGFARIEQLLTARDDDR
jgi:flagellar capping protein FliD